MPKFYLSLMLTLSLCNLTFSKLSVADEQESGWLKNKAGATESNLGARVESVEIKGERQRIEVSLPKGKKSMEEVVVIGKKEKKNDSIPPLIKIQDIQVINDLDSGRNGIIFYLGERGDFVFKFNYQDADPIYQQRP